MASTAASTTSRAPRRLYCPCVAPAELVSSAAPGSLAIDRENNRFRFNFGLPRRILFFQRAALRCSRSQRYPRRRHANVRIGPLVKLLIWCGFGSKIRYARNRGVQLCGLLHRLTRFHRRHGYRIDELSRPFWGHQRIPLSNMIFLSAGAFADQAFIDRCYIEGSRQGGRDGTDVGG